MCAGLFARHGVCLLYRCWIKPEMRCLCKLIIWICKPVRSNLSSCERTLQRVINLQLQSRAIPQRWYMQHLDGVISAALARKDPCSCKVLTAYQALWSANIEHLHTVLTRYGFVQQSSSTIAGSPKNLSQQTSHQTGCLHTRPRVLGTVFSFDVYQAVITVIGSCISQRWDYIYCMAHLWGFIIINDSLTRCD